jgi:hypothetical protein
MFRLNAALLACLCLSGCTGVQEWFMSPIDKVNSAFPPSAEVRAAQDSLAALLKDDAAQRKAAVQQFESGLALRATRCMQGVEIGRMDSVTRVRTMALSRECLNMQDAQLLQLLGMRQVAVLLARPALRPLAALGAPAPLPMAGMPEIVSGEAAAGAGVALLRGSRSEFIAIELPGGKKIADLPTLADAAPKVSLSPNGRVAAFQLASRALLFVDVERGARLWEAKELGPMLAWLPELMALLANDHRSGALTLVDLKSGAVRPHPAGLRNLTWGLPLPASTRAGALLDLGAEAKVVQEWRLAQGAITQAPTLMRNGKTIVYVAGRDLGRLDLDTGKETLWAHGDLIPGRYAKLSETTMLIDTYAGQAATRGHVFDIERLTLAPVLDQVGREGILFELAGRTGFLRRAYREAWAGDVLKTGEPRLLDDVVSAGNIERQLKQMETEARTILNVARESEIDSGEKLSPTPTRPAMSPERVQELKRRLGELPGEFRLEAAGVYQGVVSGLPPTREGRRMGTVEVRVLPSKLPLVLMLSSYDPVQWNLSLEPGAKLAAVLVSGYYRSEVVGAGAAKVIPIGGNYAYKQDTPQYNLLNLEAQRWTGKTIYLFQGKHEGASFSVGQ